MNVHLTFDVEIWCNGWHDLDTNFPASFERYTYGRSKHGDYALPKTLEILNRHSLHGVFFVEPLFSARFGITYLERIVALIQDAGQEVQLHLHPEWTDEIDPPLLNAKAGKRPNLGQYSLDEQVILIRTGRALLESSGSTPITAFRGGNFAANRDTFEALRRNDIFIDCSLNAPFEASGSDLRSDYTFSAPFRYDELAIYPVTSFYDGFGRLRPAHVTACSFEELSEALLNANSSNASHFVIVSHGFELLRPNSTSPDPIVVRRFEKICEFLAAHSGEMPVSGFPGIAAIEKQGSGQRVAVSRRATIRRYAEQALRHLPG